jgi:hypothetical protein
MEILRQHVGSSPRRWVRLRSLLERLIHFRSNVMGLHQPGHSIVSTDVSLLLQFFGNSRTPIGLTALLMHDLDLSDQGFIGLLPWTWRAPTPSVVSTRRNIQYWAQDRHGKHTPMVVDEGILHVGRCEKMPTVFFSISRSCLTRSNSRRRRRISSSSDGKRPWPGKAWLPWA